MPCGPISVQKPASPPSLSSPPIAARLSSRISALDLPHHGRELRRLGHLRRARARQRHRDLGLDAPGPRRHHVDAVGEEHRLVDVVRDEQHRDAQALPHVGQDLLHHHAGLRSRARRRARPSAAPAGWWPARARCPRAASCRPRAGRGSGSRRRAGRPDPSSVRACVSHSLREHALHLEPELDVLAHRHPGEQRVLLEHHAAVGARAGDRLRRRASPARRSA